MQHPGPSGRARRAPEPDHADGIRRFTRLTNALSRKVENVAAAVSLDFMSYKLRSA